MKGLIVIANTPSGKYALRAQALGYMKDTVVVMDEWPGRPVIIRLPRDTNSLQ